MSKILVIDDDAGVQALTVRALRTRGYETLAAHDGETGYQLACQHRPDLILCDVEMPRLDGYATLRKIREDAATATIPFVFLTGLADRSQVRQGMGLGADDYLTKPFSLEELTRAVETRLAKQALLRKEAERKLEALRGNIGLALPHEMLTPLNGILGFASLMMDPALRFSAEEVREFSRDIHHSAQRLRRLIQNFILHAETELIAGDPKRLEALRAAGPLPVRAGLEKVARARADACGRPSDLVLELADANLAIAAGYFEKIAEELVENAFKFSKPGSPVVVRLSSGDGSCRIEITDRGRGMTPAQIADVGAHMQFERRFYEQQGMGMGLSLARRLVELHGGSFSLRSETAVGTTVELSLPAAA